ncbi:cytochrome b/b6 domain-containing protein [Mesosutterella sp. OilRF-GAM-744-9]|uniref:Cytochrome b/b6 domain-containing protein n=2 Tax=Mesosutterella TaxID=2494213 RepID=A0ABS9MQJ0_9BURK|nr:MULTISPECIES: cytochrome b/b6 domain-containing protein [unclassified Mesosutterella]MCG5030891.1 cytochrome b/b6 domain-containing protein [Mesosutterella sp. oilRF-744-WT-GAM-9]MCI6530526.1 cytochrome b/b6 domain-containing protein [Mesosutterella sp.]MDL2058441.1 cytochrome b/b6 domain-containing protein [Mesosutterella sp. AGMB02718]
MTRYIQRHSLLTRVTHGVVAIACIGLAVTGVFVFVPSLGGDLMGGRFTHVMRVLHRIIAIPFILFPIYSLLRSPKGAAKLFKEDIFGKWDKDDVAWAMKFPLYLFAPAKVHMPPQHHVKSAQRLADGGLVFCCLFMALSGLVLWLNTGLLPGGGAKVAFGAETLLAARLVHDVFFCLTVILSLAHIYLGAGIWQPYRGTARIMWGDGKVSEADAAYHWGYWANQELALGKNVTEVKDEKEGKA